jgi:glutaconate CoA-transferase subunit A
MPVAGMRGSDVPAAGGLRLARDPFTGEDVYAAPRLDLDWAVLHVQEADVLGNARVYGTPFWDRVMSRAAKGVIVTAERIVPTDELARLPELTMVPHILVRAVVHAPQGAWPASCTPYYEIDRAGVAAYLAASADPDALRRYIATPDEDLRRTAAHAVAGR